MQRLAFVYLNAGIFGIPVVASFWGEEAVRLYVGAYIGNSVMGNILGTSLMRRETIRMDSRLAAPATKRLPLVRYYGPCSLTAPLSP